MSPPARPTNPTISLRPATLLDLPTIAQIFTKALTTNEVFSYIYPHRHHFSSAHQYYYHQYLRGEFLSGRVTYILAELDVEVKVGEKIESGRKVVGAAAWAARGACPGLKVERTAFVKVLMVGLYLIHLLGEYLGYLLYGPRPDADSQRRRGYLEQTLSQQKGFGLPERAYELDTLATDLEYQGFGVGRALMEWGIEGAESDGVGMVVEAGKEARGFYEKFGLEVVGEVEVKGEGWNDGAWRGKLPILVWQGKKKQ